MSVKLTPIFGITIPVIVRNGDLDVKVALSDLAVVPDKDKKKLTFKLTRQGNKSAYGDVKVEYMPAGGGAPVVVGEITRLAVFTPNNDDNAASQQIIGEGAFEQFLALQTGRVSGEKCELAIHDHRRPFRRDVRNPCYCYNPAYKNDLPVTDYSVA